MTVPTRVILIVMDSVGIGEMPDAAAYGDEGSNTVGNIAKHIPLRVPALRTLGLSKLVDIGADDVRVAGAYGRMAEQSAGKDSVTGHWEMAGIILERQLPESGFILRDVQPSHFFVPRSADTRTLE